jgi:YD repeat-containing protein
MSVGSKLTLMASVLAMSTPFIVSGAHAQPSLNPMPTNSGIDENGVDLVNWTFSYEIAPITLGPPDQDPVRVSIFLPSERDSFSSNLRIQDPTWVNSTRVSASIGSKSWTFLNGGGQSDPGSSVFVLIGGGYDNADVYARDGSVIAFDVPSWVSPGSVGPLNICAKTITKRDGEVLTYYNDYYGPSCRTLSVVSNRGYQIKYEYPSNVWTDSRSKIILINNAYEYCNPTALTCSLSMAWPYIELSSTINPRTYTNGNGKTWSRGTGGLQSPGQTSPGISWATQTYYPRNGYVGEVNWRVSSVTRDGQTWTYSYPSSDTVVGGGLDEIALVQDPLGNVKRYRRAWAMTGGDPNTGEYELPNVLTKSADPAGNVTNYSYSSQRLLTDVTLPEGNVQSATYDDWSNVQTRTAKAKPGSGLADSVTSYAYAGCCDKPTSVTNPKGAVTDYTYDPVHGGLLTETGPAPSVGAPRPMKRYAYEQRYAWVKDSGGNYVQAASPLWVLASEKTCRTSATVGDACAAGSSDEVITTYDHGPNSGPNNLWLRGKVVTADGVSIRTCYAYDPLGNKISETSPRAGLATCP